MTMNSPDYSEVTEELNRTKNALSELMEILGTLVSDVTEWMQKYGYYAKTTD